MTKQEQTAINTYFRIATTDDIDVLSKIHSESWAAGFASLLDEDVMHRAIDVRCSAIRWTSLLADGSTTIIASTNDEDVALLQFAIDASKSAEIKRVYVIPQWWGSGIAHELMSYALQHLTANRVENVQVWSAETPQARRYYEKAGFTHTSKTSTSEVLEGSNVMSTDYEYLMHLPKS